MGPLISGKSEGWWKIRQMRFLLVNHCKALRDMDLMCRLKHSEEQMLRWFCFNIMYIKYRHLDSGVVGKNRMKSQTICCLECCNEGYLFVCAYPALKYHILCLHLEPNSRSPFGGVALHHFMSQFIWNNGTHSRCIYKHVTHDLCH